MLILSILLKRYLVYQEYTKQKKMMKFSTFKNLYTNQINNENRVANETTQKVELFNQI